MHAECFISFHAQSINQSRSSDLSIWSQRLNAPLKYNAGRELYWTIYRHLMMPVLYTSRCTKCQFRLSRGNPFYCIIAMGRHPPPLFVALPRFQFARPIMAERSVKVDARERLQEEYKVWKQYHPKGFSAEPSKDENDQINYLFWNCVIPGQVKTPWEGGLYKLKLDFPEDYPYEPPHCFFDPPILHPNVFPSGTIALSLIDKTKGWKPQITVKEVLIGIQMLLNEPNFQQPAQAEAYALYSQSRLTYEEKVKEQAKKMAVV